MLDENSIENIEVTDMPDGSAKITMDIDEDAQTALMKQGMQYLIDEMSMHDKVVVMEPNEFTGEAKTWELSDDDRNALFHFGFINALKLGMKEMNTSKLEYMEDVANATTAAIIAMEDQLISDGVSLSNGEADIVFDTLMKILESKCVTGIYKHQMG
jgi:hypothetical protein